MCRETVLAASNEQMKRKYHLKAQGVYLETISFILGSGVNLFLISMVTINIVKTLKV
jgi:hypothetical protein